MATATVYEFSEAVSGEPVFPPYRITKEVPIPGSHTLLASTKAAYINSDVDFRFTTDGSTPNQQSFPGYAGAGWQMPVSAAFTITLALGY